MMLPAAREFAKLDIRVDGSLLDPARYSRENRRNVVGTLSGLGEGLHTLEAELELNLFFFFLSIDLEAASWFELVDLQDPDTCEILNDTECLFPFPSSRFLETADTETGVRLALPAN